MNASLMMFIKISVTIPINHMFVLRRQNGGHGKGFFSLQRLERRIIGPASRCWCGGSWVGACGIACRRLQYRTAPTD